MEYKDYYRILGLSRDASAEQVKQAYRKLARKYHPDVSREPRAEERFKEVSEAYEVLRDPDKRRAYDQLGSGWQDGQDFRPPPGWESSFDFRTGPGAGGFSGFGGSAFSDFFESLFGGPAPHARGGRRGAGGARPGQDERAKILVSVEDAYHGATRTIELQVPEVGPQGRVATRSRSLKVKIPAGVTQGQQIRLAGQGGAGAGGGPRGDLFLEVDLQRHPHYRVEGRDVYLDLPMAPWEAALGATVAVPTLGGKVDLKVPPGAQSGLKMRLKGRGLPGSPPGDQYVLVQIATPPADSAAREAFYRRMAEEMPFNPRRHLGV